MASFEIEEVTDLDATWADVEALLVALSDYSLPFHEAPRRDNWRHLLRAGAPAGPDSLTLLARRDGEAVGLLSCVIVRNPMLYEETYVYVDAGFVMEPFRREGITRSLLEAAESWCRSRGIYQLRTTVNAPNGVGLAAWTGLGFRPSSHNLTKWLEAPP